MAYKPNAGKLPAACRIVDDQGEVTGYRKVHVRLHGGWCSRAAGHEPWPAGGGREATRWAVGKPPHDFDIKEWELA